MKNILFALGLLLPLTACDNQPVATKYLANIMRLNCVNNCYLFSGHDTIFDIIFFASAGVV